MLYTLSVKLGTYYLIGNDNFDKLFTADINNCAGNLNI